MYSYIEVCRCSMQYAVAIIKWAHELRIHIGLNCYRQSREAVLDFELPSGRYEFDWYLNSLLEDSSVTFNRSRVLTS